jgi:hypothetical protein
MLRFGVRSFNGFGDQVEELLLGSAEFGVNLSKQCEMANELFRKRCHDICEICNGREDVDRLIARWATE